MMVLLPKKYNRLYLIQNNIQKIIIIIGTRKDIRMSKYCIKHNNGISLCVCKHKPCKILKDIQNIAQKLRTKTDYHSIDEVNTDIDEILNQIQNTLKIED